MVNLDRFSQPMPWEFQSNRDNKTDYIYSEPITCACGCDQEIDFESESSFIDDPDWEDQYYIVGHLINSKENDQLVGSQSN